MGSAFQDSHRIKATFKMKLMLILLVFYILDNTAVAKPAGTTTSDHDFDDWNQLHEKADENSQTRKTRQADSSSDLLFITDDIFKAGETMIEDGNELGNFVQFSGATKTILTEAKKTFSDLDEFVNEAKKKIENMNSELKRLDKRDIAFKDEYFPKFNEAKSELRQVRQRLRKLAGRTVTETRDLKILIDALEENNDPVLLKLALEKMKDLMLLSKEDLIEANQKYNAAIQNFENLNSAIQIQNQYIKKLLNTESAEHEAWVKKVRAGTAFPFIPYIDDEVFGCIGLCTIISNAIVAGVIGNSQAEME